MPKIELETLLCFVAPHVNIEVIDCYTGEKLYSGAPYVTAVGEELGRRAIWNITLSDKSNTLVIELN